MPDIFQKCGGKINFVAGTQSLELVASSGMGGGEVIYIYVYQSMLDVFTVNTLA